jgi:hypothetical protein
MDESERVDPRLKNHLEEAGPKSGPNIQDWDWNRLKEWTNARRLRYEDEEFYCKPDLEKDLILVEAEKSPVVGYTRNDFEKTMQKVRELIDQLEKEGDSTVYGFFKFLNEEEKRQYTIIRDVRHWG